MKVVNLQCHFLNPVLFFLIVSRAVLPQLLRERTMLRLSGVLRVYAITDIFMYKRLGNKKYSASWSSLDNEEWILNL